MKIKKLLFLSLFLLIGILLFIPNTVNADSIEISEVTVDFEGSVPVVGETPKDIIINSEQYKIVDQGWYEYENGQAANSKVTTFEFGKTYYFDMYIKANDGYTFVTPLITTKNIVWNTDYGKGIVTNPDNQYYGCVFISGYYTTGIVHANIELDGTTDIIPIVGGTPQYLTISSDEFVVDSQWWYDEGLKPVSTFEAGKEYYYILTLKHKTAAGWDSASTLKVNGIDWLLTFSGAEPSQGILGFAGTLIPIEIKEYTITIETDEGATVTPNGTVKVEKGKDQTFEIIVNLEYELISVKVDGVEKISELKDNKLTLTNMNADSKIVVETAHLSPGVSVEGEREPESDDSIGNIPESGEINNNNNNNNIASGNNSTNNNPQTGDNIISYIIMSVISGLGIIFIGITLKKTQIKSKH